MAPRDRTDTAQPGVHIRPALPADVPVLARLDYSYPTGRVLALERAGRSPDLTFTFRWQAQPPGTASAYTYTEPFLRETLARADLFLVAEVDGATAGLLVLMVAPATGAAEITDLAIHRPCRRRGAGRALLEAAADFARSRNLRALWVEPRADNAEAIEFYGSLGFRFSGFNDRLYSNRDHEAGKVTLFMYLELPRHRPPQNNRSTPAGRQ